MLEAVWAGFADPPDEARPRAWWHWMDGNVDADGIRLDLEWLHGVGVRGVQMFDGGMGTPLVVPERVEFGSAPWREALHLAKATARRLGLEFAVATSPGWSAAGGPWVSRGDAMKKFVWSEIVVTGGATVELALPPLPDAAGPFQDLPRWGSDPEANRFGRDWITIAVPDDPAQRALRPVTVTASRVHQGELKAGFGAALDYYALDAAPEVAGPAIDPGRVLDLSAHLGADGVLRWEAPPGVWRVLRFGASLTGQTDGPASPEATGLEVDKLDAEAVRRYFGTYLDLIGPGLGALVDGDNERLPVRSAAPLAELPVAGAWELTLPGRTAIRLEHGPVPWTELGEEGFAGVGVYAGHVDVDAAFLRDRRILAGLGEVGDIARVLVNGVDCGISWTAPFEADITAALRPGRNVVVVEVANAWMNRLIDEARHPTGQIFAPVADVYEPDAEVRPAGLSGPVVLRACAP